MLGPTGTRSSVPLHGARQASAGGDVPGVSVKQGHFECPAARCWPGPSLLETEFPVFPAQPFGQVSVLRLAREARGFTTAVTEGNCKGIVSWSVFHFLLMGWRLNL